jgi:hypothetical protein
MSTKTIVRHTCDTCGIERDEVKGDGFLPCGGPDNWSAWMVKAGTASHFYGTNSEVEFCSYSCAIQWMEMEKKKLKT